MVALSPLDEPSDQGLQEASIQRPIDGRHTEEQCPGISKRPRLTRCPRTRGRANGERGRERSKVQPSQLYAKIRRDPELIRRLFSRGEYAYKTRIRAAVYEQHEEELQVELLEVQNWVKQSG